MTDPDPDDGPELVPLTSAPWQPSRRAALGLLAGISAVTLLFSHPEFSSETLPTPEPVRLMQHPDKMANVLDTLRKFYPKDHVAYALENPKAHFIHSSPVSGNSFSIYNRKSHSHLDQIVAKHKGNRVGMTCALVEHFEGRISNVYKDTEKLPTTGAGFLLYPVGKDRPREKLVKRTLGIEYKDLYEGKIKLTDPQIRKLARAFILERDAHLEETLRRANKGNAKAPRNMDPVARAFIITMLYQSPALLEGSSKNTREQVRGVTYPLLRIMCDKNSTEDKKEQAMQDLIHYYAASVQMKYVHENPISNNMRLAYSMRGALIESATTPDADNRNAAAMLAMQIRTSVRDQRALSSRTPVIVLDGLPPGTGFRELLEDPLCQFDRNAECVVLAPGLGLMAVHRNTRIELTAVHDEKYEDVIILSDEKPSAREALYAHFDNRLTLR
jgi:hypothetical protein